MTQARLYVDLPAGSWLGDVSGRFPEMTFGVRAAAPVRSDCVELVSVSGPDLEDALTVLCDHESVVEYAILDQTATDAIVQIRSTTTEILCAASAAGVPLETPFDVQAGTATIDVLSTHSRLSEFGERLRANDVEFEVGSIQPVTQERALLTNRQLELLRTAVDLGYYERPRRCTLTELADAVDIAKSTCCEILQRAEQNVVEFFLENARLPAETDARPEMSAGPAEDDAVGRRQASPVGQG